MARQHTQACPIAGALNIIGDHWTLLIIREAFYGAARFGEFQRNTGIAKNLLTTRLNMLVENGVFERTSFADRGTTHNYRLTEKGRALKTVMIAVAQWGNEHVYGNGAEPVLITDKITSMPIADMVAHNAQGEPVSDQDIRFTPGPGAHAHTRKRLEEAKAVINNQ